MRNLLSLLVAIVVGGCERAPGEDDDAGADVDAGVIAVDAVPNDGVLPIDAPPGPCPVVAEPGTLPPNDPPTGTWRITWRCTGGCNTYPAPALVSATAVDVQSDNLRWRSGSAVIANHATTATARCLRVHGDDSDGCRIYYDFCNVQGGTRISTASWYDTATQWRQTWEAVASR